MLSQKPWRAEAVIQLLLGVFVSLCLGVIAVGVLQRTGISAFKSPDSFANLLLATLSFHGVAWILIFIFLKRHEVDWRDAFGFRQPNLIKKLGLALGVLALALPVVLSLQYLSVITLDKIGWPPEDQRAVEVFVHADSWWLRGYLAFFAVVLAPVAEEFIFRGLLYPFIKQLGWPKLAWFGVSFLFALIHLNAATFVPLFVFALVLTWLYKKTDTLLASIFAHSLFNATNLAALYFLPQINQFLQNQWHVQLLK